MTTETLPAVTDDERDHKRQLALLKAVGLDRVQPEQRELALAIAKRYDLDLLLKHLVLIDGKPYITRDGLLWVAHRSGALDGIEVTKPVIEDKHWYCEAAVYRKDMSRPFRYGGRYPVDGKNKAFAPEMATKVAECMALRRAFNVSAPSAEERWDVEVPTAVEPEPPKSLSEKVAEKVATVIERTDDGFTAVIETPKEEAAPAGEPAAEPPTADQPIPEPAYMTQCESRSPFANEGEEPAQCRRENGHKGAHRTDRESWPA